MYSWSVKIAHSILCSALAEKYELAEMDRKKPKVKRQGLTVPFIRYHSCSMPLMQDITPTQPNSRNEKTSSGLVLSEGRASSRDDDKCDSNKVDIVDAEAMLDSMEAEVGVLCTKLKF